MLTDSERAALVEELAEELYVFDELSMDGADMDRWSDADPTLKDVYRSRAHHKVMPIIDRLFTTRPEPAADAVERVASALREAANEFYDGDGAKMTHEGRFFEALDELYRRQAIAALQATLAAADAVERAAKALADHAAVEGENWYVDDDGTEHFPKWDDLPDEESYLGGDQEWPNPGRNHFRAKARAALQAAAVEPTPGLDELLDSVDCPQLDVDPVDGSEEPAYVAYIMPRAGGVWEGTGPTRMAAITDAVRQANASAEGERE